MIDLNRFEIKRTYNSNVSEEFSVYFRNHDDHEYKFTIRVDFKIGGDIVYIDINSLRYFNTLRNIINNILNLLDVEVDSHRIRYTYSKGRYISFDENNEVMKIYCGQILLADVYLQEDYIELYDYNYLTCKSKSSAFCFLDQNKLHLMRADDLDLANKLLEDSKSEILAGINYFNFLTKR